MDPQQNDQLRDAEDDAFLKRTADAARAQGIYPFLHLDQAIGRWNYIRIANEIARDIPAGRLLDWGCGYGQMAYLLRRRGFTVTAFDVGNPAEPMPDLPLTRAVEILRDPHPTTLPFPDGSFDAVLSCGVLEHVDEFSSPGNELVSLREIRRVLRPGGWFSVYQLPQQRSWQEALVRLLKVGYSHPRRFTEREIVRLLRDTGFRVERVQRNNLFPKNLTGLPERLRALYGGLGRAAVRLDTAFSTVPGLNRFAGVLELVARRSD